MGNLLPCAFCGGPAETWERPCVNGPLHQTGCRACGIRSTASTARQAEAKWNKRVPNTRAALALAAEPGGGK